MISKNSRNVRSTSRSRNLPNIFPVSNSFTNNSENVSFIKGTRSTFVSNFQTIDDKTPTNITHINDSKLNNVSFDIGRPKAGHNLRRANLHTFIRKRVDRSISPLNFRPPTISIKTPIYSRFSIGQPRQQPQNNSFSFINTRSGTPKTVRSTTLELARKSVNNILTSQKLLEDVHKNSTLTINEMLMLCKARCEDNNLSNWEQHASRFVDSCLSQCTDGKLIFKDVFFN